jgi:hypothetical protein
MGYCQVTGFAPEMQAKQYVAVVAGALSRFRVLTTDSDKHYLFQPLDVAMDPFPVLKADLRDDIRRALAHGWGNSSESDPPPWRDGER